jgi:HEAT repeat protein
MGIFDPNIVKLRKSGNAEGLIKALGHKKPEIREEAASALGELGGDEAVAALAAACKDSSIARKSAIEALSRIGSPEAVARLEGILTRSDRNARKKIAKELKEIGLGKIPSGEFWHYICDSAAIQTNDAYKEAARRSVGAALSCLGSPDRNLRWDALRVLEELALPYDEKSAAAVARQLDNKKNDLYIVEEALKVLGGFKSKSLEGILFTCLDPNYFALFAATNDGSKDNSAEAFAAAVAAIGAICDEGMARRLLPVLEREIAGKKGAPSSKEAAKARQARVGALLRLLGERIPAELLKTVIELEGFDEEKLEIARRIGPESVPDDLVPALAKRLNKGFARELLRKKGAVAGKELVRIYLASKDKDALRALEGMELDAGTVAPLAEILPYSDFGVIEAVAGALSKAQAVHPTIADYAAVLRRDWGALRERGALALGPMTVVLSKGASSEALRGSAAEIFGLLCGLDYGAAYSSFYDLPPGEFKDEALDAMLASSSSQAERDKVLGSAIASMAGALRSGSAKEETKKRAAQTLKRLYAEGALSDAMKREIVACKGAVVYRERKSSESGHYDDCLTSGPPDTWHTDRGNHSDSYVDVRFEP